MTPDESKPKSRKSRRWIKLAIVILPFVLGISYWYYQEHRPITIQQLLDPDTRLYTFHRIWREEEHHEMYDHLQHWRHFRDFHASIEILECPQTDGDPIYLVLREHSPDYLELLNIEGIRAPEGPPMSKLSDMLKADQWRRWWKGRKPATPIRAGPPLKPTWERVSGLTLDVFDSKVRRLNPFGGDNVVDGVIYDLNGDGQFERVGAIAYGFHRTNQEPFTPQVLNVVRIKREQEFVFSVLLNLP